MSPRKLATAAIAGAALIAVPAAASARPPEQVDTGPVGVPVTELQAADPVAAPSAGVPDTASGSDTLTVLALAGGTLLAGAAGGFGAGRVLVRRQALRP
jgi:hypothetical protein